MGSIRGGQGKKIEGGLDILQLGFRGFFQIRVVLEALRLPGLGEQAIGASDFILQRLHSQTEDVKSLAARTQRGPFLCQLTA